MDINELLGNVEQMAESVLQQVEAQNDRVKKREAIKVALLAIIFPDHFQMVVNEHKARSN